MGRKTKRLLGVVAAIAIPFAAPAIAAAIGVSSTIGIAATGAALGATAASATGGDPLMGAIVGGVGSYLNAPSAAAGPTTQQAQMLAAQDASLGVTPTVGPNAVAYQAPVTAPISTATAMTPQAQILASQDAAFGITPTVGQTAMGYQAPTADFGAALSGVSGPVTTQSQMLAAQDAAFGVAPTVGPNAVGYQAPVATTGSTAIGAAGSPFQVATQPNVAAGLTSPAAATATATTPAVGSAASPFQVAAQAPAATAPLTAGQKALEFTKAIGGDLIKTAAMVYALGAANVPGEIPAEQMAMYQEELERLARENPAAYQAQLNEAQKFLQQAEALDPDYFGQQRARSEQIRGARQKSAGLRGLTGRQRAAAERQYDIATGRAAGTAYESGAQTALTGQIQTRQAGLALMPKPSEYSTLSSLQNLGGIYRDQATARRQYAQDVGMFADLGASIYDKGRNIYG